MTNLARFPRLCSILFLFAASPVAPAQDRSVDAHDPVIAKEGGTYYLYCTGKVSRLFLNGRLITLELLKTALFIRKKNKGSSWMEELHQFEEPVNL